MRNLTFRHKIARFTASIAIAMALASPALADEQAFPRTTEFVNDWAHVLTTEDVSSLTSICRKLQTAHGYQLLVVTLASLNGEDINHAAVRFGNEQQAGRKGADTGVVLMLAMQERKVYIATGSGTKAVLTDSTSGRISRDEMRPLLREGRTGDALRLGAERIVSVIEHGGEGEPMPLSEPSGGRGGVPPVALFGLIFGVLALVGVAVRASLKCPRCGHWLTVSNEVVQLPGLLSNGYGIRTRVCSSCGFSDQSRYTIYQSGGGGLSGGGSSGGGWSSGSGGGGFSGGGGSFDGGGGGSSW